MPAAGDALPLLSRGERERELRDGREKLARLIGSARDAIVEVDEAFRVTLLNAAGERVFACTSDLAHGQPVDRLLGATSTQQLRALADALDRRTGADRSLWIPGGLRAEPAAGLSFPVEATLSRFEVRGDPFYTVILRNMDERLEAERTIQSLTATTEYLREEIAEEHGFGDIVGRSPALRTALKAVAQVAATSASVLLLGETAPGRSCSRAPSTSGARDGTGRS